MANLTIFLCFIYLLLNPIYLASSSSSSSSDSDSFTSLLISQKGLDFAKDILITKAISSLTPIQVPQIEKYVKIPFIGNVKVVLSDIIVNQINTSSTHVVTGDTGIVIVASGATANLTMNWYYSYSTWLFVPITISDQGTASILVQGMEVGLTLGLADQQGTLNLSLMECGCNVKNISINLDGGASWFYQGLVDAFQGQILSAVENSVSKKIKEGVSKLDAKLQSLPKEIPVDDVASLNVTFVNDPLLRDSSIVFEINGLVTARNEDELLPFSYKKLEPLIITCNGPSKMIGISLHEAVFNSGSSVYFYAGTMNWVVENSGDQSLLNTAGWKYVVPQLYRKYPNDDMKLNISFSSPPVIIISSKKIDVTAQFDMTINVVDANGIIPVACISVVISAAGSVDISGNRLVGSVGLDDFALSLKWSQIGKLYVNIIQPVMWTFLKTVATPYLNSRLSKGFPLPIIDGFTLQNADIVLYDSFVSICSDVVYED